MSAECPGCGGPVKAIPGYESRTTYCSRACQVRANRRRNRKGVADLADELERLRAERDALRSVVRRYRDGWTDLPLGREIRWCREGPTVDDPDLIREWVPMTPAEADAIRNATGRSDQ